MRNNNPEKYLAHGNYALVTGASQGIGKSISEKLAGLGYNVILVALPSDELKQTAIELENRFGITTECIAIDLAKDGTPHMVFDKVKRLGVKPSILINNAGIGYVGRFEDNPLDYLSPIDQIKRPDDCTDDLFIPADAQGEFEGIYFEYGKSCFNITSPVQSGLCGVQTIHSRIFIVIG